MRTDGSIKNLIFDLGGVILDLSVDTTLQSLAELSGIDTNKVRQLFVDSPEFESYEKGEISDSDFRTFVRRLYNIEVADNVLDDCWNAMLVGFPLKKLQLLQSLKKTHKVFLLSNTNNIHVHYINNTLLPKVNQNSLEDFFHRSYYSHRMKKRKPDPEIFQEVLEKENLDPHQTLFLDDNKSNVEGAGKLGIKTVHVVNPNMIFEYFS